MEQSCWFGADVPTSVRITRLYTAFEDTYELGFTFDGESHPFFELVYVEKGSVGAASGGEVFSLSAGQLILHAPMVFHRIWAAQNTTPTVLIFSFSAHNFPVSGSRICTVAPDLRSQFRMLLEGIYHAFDIRAELHVMRVRDPVTAGLAVNRLEFLLQSVAATAPPDARDRSPSAQQFRQIMSVLDAHLSEPLSNAQLAALCCMSESAMKKSVARYTGLGTMRCFTEMKMLRAAQLLSDGAHVYQAAESVGFSDPNYFSTVFRRITGQSPSRFRARQAAQEIPEKSKKTT